MRRRPAAAPHGGASPHPLPAVDRCRIEFPAPRRLVVQELLQCGGLRLRQAAILAAPQGLFKVRRRKAEFGKQGLDVAHRLGGSRREVHLAPIWSDGVVEIRLPVAQHVVLDRRPHDQQHEGFRHAGAAQLGHHAPEVGRRARGREPLGEGRGQDSGPGASRCRGGGVRRAGRRRSPDAMGDERESEENRQREETSHGRGRALALARLGGTMDFPSRESSREGGAASVRPVDDDLSRPPGGAA